MEFKLNTIEEAIEEFRQGRFVIVIDDEDRENEGDFIMAAEKITPEHVNFMLKNGRGVLCAPITENRCKELNLDMQVHDNTSLLGTPFTVTVDLLGNGCTTGVSMHDRAMTIRALADPATQPSDLGRPGHINPLRARNGGVIVRAGHTEAAVDLARLAGQLFRHRPDVPAAGRLLRGALRRYPLGHVRVAVRRAVLLLRLPAGARVRPAAPRRRDHGRPARRTLAAAGALPGRDAVLV